MRKLKNEELSRLSIDEFKQARKTPITLVLDNVRSMNNIGSAFRTADAFRLEQIILTGITAQPPHRDIHKTALGATETVAWQYFTETTEAIQWLQQNNYQVWAVEQAVGSRPLQQFTPAQEARYALVFGNEVKGVSDAVMKMVDGCLEIPQLGSKHSLNIAVSVGVVSWDLAQKMNVFEA